MSVQLRIVALPSGGVPAPRDSSMESVTRGYVMVSGVTWHYENYALAGGSTAIRRLVELGLSTGHYRLAPAERRPSPIVRLP
jgi:hypothetical protein